jgi:hypothetical protein
MYRKIHALFLSLAMMLAMSAGLCAKPAPVSASPAAMGAHLLSSLPASDFLMYVDTQRLLTDTVPTFLATRPELLAKMNADLDKVKVETGVDLRSFDMLAVGVRYGSKSARAIKSVFLVRGRFDSSAIINAGFAAASKDKNAFQQQSQEEYKGKTLYIVGPPSVKATTSTTNASSSERSQGVKATGGAGPSVSVAVASPLHKSPEKAAPCTQDVPCAIGTATVPEQQKVQLVSASKTAVTALDSNTIAAGDMESVRATIDAEAGGAHADDELVQLATRNSSALVGFSGNQPAPLVGNHGSNPSSQDPMVKSLEGIQQYYGSFSMSGTDSEIALNLRMESPEQARAIKEMVNVFKPKENAANKAPSSDIFEGVYGLLRTLTVNVEGNEVQLQLKLTQSDLAPFFPKL